MLLQVWAPELGAKGPGVGTSAHAGVPLAVWSYCVCGVESRGADGGVEPGHGSGGECGQGGEAKHGYGDVEDPALLAGVDPCRGHAERQAE
jgi:hypothetical protein